MTKFASISVRKNTKNLKSILLNGIQFPCWIAKSDCQTVTLFIGNFKLKISFKGLFVIKVWHDVKNVEVFIVKLSYVFKCNGIKYLLLLMLLLNVRINSREKKKTVFAVYFDDE